MSTLQQTSAIIAIVAMMLATMVQATKYPYVELYRDADYKHKLTRIDDVEEDICCSIACEALDNTVTSARWGDLPEKTSSGDDAMISFYVDRDCREHDIWWRTKIQSDDDLYFPSNFKLDGINDQISAFMVWNTNKIHGSTVICTTESGTIDGGNTTVSAVPGSGSGAATNNTIGDL